MPRKKMNGTEPKKNGTVPDATKHVDDEGFLCLKGDLFWRWRALDAELRAALAEMESAQQQIQVEIAKQPELSALLQKKAALAGTISTAKTELLTVQGEIENTLGISLKEHAFDDKTGRLYNLTAGSSQGDPVKPRSRKQKSASA